MIFTNLIDVAFTTILLGRLADSVNIAERIIIAIVFKVIEMKVRNTELILFTKYILITPDLGDRICLFRLFYSDVQLGLLRFFNLILTCTKEVCIICLQGLFCILVQIIILRVKLLNTEPSIKLLISRERCRRREGYTLKHKHKFYPACRKKLRLNQPTMRNLKYVQKIMMRKRDSIMLYFRSRYHYKYFTPSLGLFMPSCSLFLFWDILKKKKSQFKNKIQTRIVRAKSDKIFLTNLGRKTFHLFVFLMFYNISPLKVLLAEISLLVLVVISDNSLFGYVFKEFLSKNDRGRMIMSHVYLLAAVLFPYYLLSYNDYLLNLTSICILDSLTSFIGTFMGKKAKSYTGTIVALCCTLVFSYFCLPKTDILYFLLASVVERSVLMNDNISIPLFSVIYFRSYRVTKNLKKLTICT